MNRQLIGLMLAIVLAILIDQNSACCFGWKEKPLLTIQKLSKVPLRYDHEQLFKRLGFSIQFPDLHLRNVGIDLAATKDKDKPNVLANKYSINDLLDLLKVYKPELTVERYLERLDFCKSLSPDKAAKRPENDYVLGLIKANKYIEGYRHDYHEDEVRTPQEFAYYKNLHDYCMFIFRKYTRFLQEEFRLEDGELDKRAMDLFEGVEQLFRNNPKRYPAESLGVHPDPIPIALTDFTSTKQPNEKAEIKAICSELIKQFAPLGKFIPMHYRGIHRYCNSEPWKSGL